MKGILWATPTTIIQVDPRYLIKPQAQHLTLQYGVELHPFYSCWLGYEFLANLKSETWNGSIQAIAVELPFHVRHLCQNQQPHITLSWQEGCQPVQANRMLATKFNYRLLNRNVNLRIEFLEWKNDS